MKAQRANAKDDGTTTDSAAPHCVTPLMPQSAFGIAASLTPPMPTRTNLARQINVSAYGLHHAPRPLVPAHEGIEVQIAADRSR